MSDVFVSCSVDWSVKLWHQEHTSPLYSFSSARVDHAIIYRLHNTSRPHGAALDIVHTPSAAHGLHPDHAVLHWT